MEEFKELEKVLNNFKKNDVAFIGTFISFEKNKIKNNGITAYGDKRIINKMIETMQNIIDVEKNNLIDL